MCAYNEERTIGSILKSIVLQSLPESAHLEEVIVVSSGSTDATDSIVSSFARTNSKVVLIRQQDRRGKAAAMDEIFHTFTGDVLIVVTADSALPPSAFGALLRKLEDPYVGVVSGRPFPSSSRSLLRSVLQLHWELHDETLATLNDSNLCSHATGELMALRRKAITQIPETVINEDAYLAVVATKRGYLVKYARDALVFIDAPLTGVELIRQRSRILEGHLQLRRLTGVFPRNLETMALGNPGRALGILARVLRRHPGAFLALFAAIVIEVLCHVNAGLRHGPGRNRWRMIRTSAAPPIALTRPKSGSLR